MSYADFITLLFAFFVVLYASAQIDKKKVGMLSESIQYGFQEMGIFGGSPAVGTRDESSIDPMPADLDRLELRRIQVLLDQSLSEEIAKGEVAVHSEREGLVVSLRELGFFDIGSAQLRQSARSAFGMVVKVLKDHPRTLRVEGHTDDVPIHNRQFHSNWELSTARATEVVRVLISEYEYPPSKLSASGYGQFHPSAKNTTETGRQTNRRVDIVILSATHASSVSDR